MLIKNYLRTYPGPIHPHSDEKLIDISEIVGLTPAQVHKLKYGEDTIAGSIEGLNDFNRDNVPNLYK